VDVLFGKRGGFLYSNLILVGIEPEYDMRRPAQPLAHHTGNTMCREILQHAFTHELPQDPHVLEPAWDQFLSHQALQACLS